MLAMGVEEVSKPCEEVALDAVGREFGEQGGVTHCIKCLIMSRETAIISCLTLRASIHCWENSRSITRVE